MTVDSQKIKDLLAGTPGHAADGELRREGDVLFIGADLPVQEALESIYASDCQTPVEIFFFSFTDLPSFVRMEEMVRAVKKNFRGYLLASFHFLPATAVVNQAYAAGIDLVDVPTPAGDALAQQAWLATLDYARTIFPRWGVLATVRVGEGPPRQLQADIDLLLARGVLPLLILTPAAARHEESEVAALFDHLRQGWRAAGAVIRPLQPLLQLTMPLVAQPPRRGIAGLLERFQDAQLRAAADLRRQLRVREVEQSFESAGL